MTKKGLGKGFEALISNIGDSTYSNQFSKETVKEIPINKIVKNPKQPRKVFFQEDLIELSQSIKTKGIIQPILVREINKEKYELIAGERRFKAAQLAGLDKVRSIICNNVSDHELLELALIENIQRKDLNPIEEAMAYSKLIEDHNYTHQELAKRVGKNRATITNALRILTLPNEILDDISSSKISTGHAKCLLSLKVPTQQIELKNLILEKQLSVRAIEKIIKSKAIQPQNKKNTPEHISQENLEKELSNLFQTNVKIQASEKYKGKIIFSFYNQEDLQRIINQLIQS